MAAITAQQVRAQIQRQPYQPAQSSSPYYEVSDGIVIARDLPTGESILTDFHPGTIVASFRVCCAGCYKDEYLPARRVEHVAEVACRYGWAYIERAGGWVCTPCADAWALGHRP